MYCFELAKLQKQKGKKGNKCYQTLFLWITLKKENMFIFASNKSINNWHIRHPYDVT